MGDKLLTEIGSIAAMIVGLAIIAVLVSNKANTGNVISEAAKGFARDIGAAVKPVTG